MLASPFALRCALGLALFVAPCIGAGCVVDLPDPQALLVVDARIADQQPADALFPLPPFVWQLREDLRDKPPALHGAKLAYAPTLGEEAPALYLYGGRDAQGKVSAELWRYAADGWRLICTDCPPGPRHGHGWVYDEKIKSLVLLGGNDGARLHSEIWSFDGQAWVLAEQRLPQGSRREIYAIRVSHRARTVVFGGMDVTGAAHDDLYECESRSKEEITCQGPIVAEPHPSARRDAGSAGAYVPRDAPLAQLAGSAVLVGGFTDASTGTVSSLHDAWAWSGTAWTRVCEHCIGRGLASAAVVYDPRVETVLVVGGWSVGVKTELAGTWRIEPNDEPFTLLMRNDPRPRDSSAIAYDPERRLVVLYGGNGWSCPEIAQGTGNWVNNCRDTLELALKP